LIISSCDTKKDKRIRVDDVFADGEISKDTVYNGLIKFYDTATKQLIQTANYKEGILDGDRIDYYINGKTKLQLQYKNGKINGEVKIFDSTGEISETQNIYFDLRVGPSIEYKNKQVSQYYFYSIENKELLHINYDSIEGKKIDQLNDTSFFFWHFNDYSTSESNTPKTDLFLYLPNPPKFNFQYSLCIIDDKYNIKQTIKDLNPEKSWDIVNLDYTSLKSNESFAIRLTIDNELDNDDRIASMFKRL
jgi:hypothetical protein